MPAVSVLMVVLNEETHLARAARSVLDQTYSDVELLIIDGGSSDRTPAIMRTLAAQDRRVRLLRNPARVIPAGLNVGLSAAQGDYVARLDGHSIWAPTVVERGLEVLEGAEQCAGIGGRRRGVGHDRRGRAIAEALGSRLGVGNSIYHYGTEPAETDHATCGLYRTAVARAVGGWDEGLPVNEDVDFDHRIRRSGWKIRFEPAMETSWVVQSDLRKLFRQYRRYGRGKSQMIRKNGWQAIRARHTAAPALVTTTVAGALLAALTRRWVVLAPTAAYGIALAGAARATRPRDTDTSFSVFLAALSAMHFGWGLGFLEEQVLRLRPHQASAAPLSTLAGEAA